MVHFDFLPYAYLSIYLQCQFIYLFIYNALAFLFNKNTFFSPAGLSIKEKE